MSQNTPDKLPKDSSLLIGFILALVIVHFLFVLASPFVFIYEVKPLYPLGYGSAFWLCQPVLIAICLMVVKSTSQVCRTLVYIDVGRSVLQKASVLLLYAFVDKIG
jgi:hypothetical protein